MSKIKKELKLQKLKDEFGFVTYDEYNQGRFEVGSEEYAKDIYNKFKISKITVADMKNMGMSNFEIIEQLGTENSIFAKNMMRDVLIRSGAYEQRLDRKYLQSYAESLKDIIGDDSYKKLINIPEHDKNYVVNLLHNYATLYPKEAFEGDSEREIELATSVQAALEFYNIQRNRW